MDKLRLPKQTDEGNNDAKTHDFEAGADKYPEQKQDKLSFFAAIEKE
ncbi:MAG: hypothetical protein HY074_00540 [Deltaproteobacteria bacterium]|nr:hypothetical protein [Deltaproteobacteria bacterium]